MASQHLQIGLVGPGSVLVTLLHTIGPVSLCSGQRAEEDFRGNSGLLQRLQRFDTAVVRFGFLR